MFFGTVLNIIFNSNNNSNNIGTCMKTKITNKTLINYKINSCFYTNYKLIMQLNF